MNGTTQGNSADFIAGAIVTPIAAPTVRRKLNAVVALRKCILTAVERGFRK